MFEQLELLLRTHVDSVEFASFLCQSVAGVSTAGASIQVAIGHLLTAARRDPALFSRVITLLASEPILVKRVHATHELLTKAVYELQAPCGVNRTQTELLQLFYGQVADLFPDEKAVHLYLRVHLAPLEHMNALKAELVARPWNYGAFQDDQQLDQLGFLGKFTEGLWNAILGIAPPKPAPKMSLV